MFSTIFNLIRSEKFPQGGSLSHTPCSLPGSAKSKYVLEISHTYLLFPLLLLIRQTDVKFQISGIGWNSNESLLIVTSYTNKEESQLKEEQENPTPRKLIDRNINTISSIIFKPLKGLQVSFIHAQQSLSI